MKICTRCLLEKPLTEFYKAKASRSGIHSHCKVCFADYWRANKARKAPLARQARIKRVYGISVREYDALIAKGCAICGGEAKTRIVLDHCHATGSVRAALCHTCNVTLGRANDSPDLLRKMADYIEAHAVS